MGKSSEYSQEQGEPSNHSEGGSGLRAKDTRLRFHRLQSESISKRPHPNRNAHAVEVKENNFCRRIAKGP